MTCLHLTLAPHTHSDVSAHKINETQTFGKKASEMWKKKMQMAEGPNAFRQGIEAMVEAYANDPSRKRYIRELSLQSSRHHFSRTIWLADIAPFINL